MLEDKGQGCLHGTDGFKGDKLYRITEYSKLKGAHKDHNHYSWVKGSHRDGAHSFGVINTRPWAAHLSYNLIRCRVSKGARSRVRAQHCTALCLRRAVHTASLSLKLTHITATLDSKSENSRNLAQFSYHRKEGICRSGLNCTPEHQSSEILSCPWICSLLKTIHLGQG